MIEKTTCEKCKREYQCDVDLGLNVEYVNVDKDIGASPFLVHNLPSEDSVFARIMRNAERRRQTYFDNDRIRSIVHIEGIFPICPHCEHRGSRVFHTAEGGVETTLEVKIEKGWKLSPEMQKTVDELTRIAVDKAIMAVDAGSRPSKSVFTIYDQKGNIISSGEFVDDGFRTGSYTEIRLNDKDDDANST